MEWLEWSADAFAAAARQGKPVLLSITAPWCAPCREMDRATYGDAAVRRLIAERFVPIRVDSDRRPDINERYNLGGWPTTAFLTAAGDVLAGSTFIAPADMPDVLARVADAFAGRTDWPPSARAVPHEGALPDDDQLIEQVFRDSDTEYGGFGEGPKFPVTAPLHLALSLARDRGDRRWLPFAERTFDAIAGGGLYDPADGGYRRYAGTRDWREAPQEKLLETNAALLSAFADAALTLGRPQDRDRVAALAAFIRGRLSSSDGGFAGCTDDPTRYLDSNAAALSALLDAAAVLDDVGLAREALGGFERVLLGCYRPGHGVAHYLDGGARVRGLLADQLGAMDALLDAFELTGDEPYRMLAEELGHYCTKTLLDPKGGFRDRVPGADDVGLLTEPLRPFVGNCEAARVFRRLGRAAGEPEFEARGREALAAAGSVVASHGVLAAHYLLAMLDAAAG